MLTRKLRLEVPRAFAPLLKPSRYKGAHGGRGSGKSHFFAERVVDDSLYHRGLRTLCVREIQKSLAGSSKLLIEDKIKAMGVQREFKVFNDVIETPGDGIITFEGMQNHTAETIKSKEGFGRAWIEEAQTLSTRSLTLLRPTIRSAGSEIWASWNPTRKSDAVDEFFRGLAAGKDPEIACVQANWRDNPWFPPELERERLRDLERYPERYDHIWEGGYAKAFEGAYFAKELALCRSEGRIGKVAADPLLSVRAFFDIGGSGARADAMAIWIVQFVGREIRVLDYLEGQGQVLAYHVTELRKRGWSKAICALPHDGVNENNVTGKRYVDHLREAGFECLDPIPNQGRGAAMLRVEAVRRLFSQIWFNEETTEAGRDALGYYHEKRDEDRGIGLGPDHDWSSHAADAFGLMCICYQPPQAALQPVKRKVVAYG